MIHFKNSKADLVQGDDLTCVGPAAMEFCSRRETLDSTPNTIRQSEDFAAQEQGGDGGKSPRKLLREQGNSC